MSRRTDGFRRAEASGKLSQAELNELTPVERAFVRAEVFNDYLAQREGFRASGKWQPHYTENRLAFDQQCLDQLNMVIPDMQAALEAIAAHQRR